MSKELIVVESRLPALSEKPPAIVAAAGRAAQNAWRDFFAELVKRRMTAAALREELSAHSFRVAVLTDLIDQGVAIEDVQDLAGHADSRTTKLYDRTQRRATRNLVQRIRLGITGSQTSDNLQARTHEVKGPAA